LDRDGVINQDAKPYVLSADQMVPEHGALEGMKTLHDAGFALYVVSNQQAVSKGFFTMDELERMSEKIQSWVRPLGFQIADFKYATALDEENHPWRKPAPGMILAHQADHNLNLEGAFLVGDRWSDIEAGARAGVRPLLLLTGAHGEDEVQGWSYAPEAIFPDLKAAADYIVANTAP
jgi:D-glycero-D-manno-heptose 1,7-bisphosphate phosphatase